MNERDFQDRLKDLLENDIALEDTELEGEIRNVGTFDERGIMTYNKGLVVRTEDSEFQVTIVQSM